MERLSISRVLAREILDSRGKPTVEVEVHTDAGTIGRASVPSGASTGSAEAVELRDGDARRYDGQGVTRAVAHVNEILDRLLRGQDPRRQFAIDQQMIAADGTPAKVKLGGNAILGVSLAVAHAAAAAKRCRLYQHLRELWEELPAADAPSLPAAGARPALFLPGFRRDAPCLPLPMTNMISGGLHAGGQLDIQDVLVMPVGAADYPQALEWMVRVYRRLGRLLAEAGHEGYLVGDEGGYGPRLTSNQAALEFVLRAIEAAGLQPGAEMAIALDVAASHFYHEGTYCLRAEQGTELRAGELIDRLEMWCRRFPIVSIEDGVSEHDREGWRELTARLGDRVQLVGDDLFATQESRVRDGLRERLANSVLIKVNQVGTLSETLQTARTARQGGFTLVVSARSGETEDATLADLAVGLSAEQIKIGSVARSERLAKYNQLLRLAELPGLSGLPLPPAPGTRP